MNEEMGAGGFVVPNGVGGSGNACFGFKVEPVGAVMNKMTITCTICGEEVEVPRAEAYGQLYCRCGAFYYYDEGLNFSPSWEDLELIRGNYKMKETLRPLGKLLLVQRLDALKESEGGLLIPEAARELPTEGVILEIGEKVESKVAKGDKVIFGKYAGTKVVCQGREYLLLQEEELLGVLEVREERVH